MHGVICRVAKLYCREQIHTSYTITDTGYELVVTTVLFGLSNHSSGLPRCRSYDGSDGHLAVVGRIIGLPGGGSCWE